MGSEASNLPVWLIDIGTIVTIIGFFITLRLLCIARHIRRSFLSKARLAPTISDLESSLSKLSVHLKSWANEKNDAIKELSVCRGLLDSVKNKLPDDRQKKCKNFIKIMKQKRHFFSKDGLRNVNEDQAWELYAGLSEITTILIQLNEDSKWD
ncbi:MULTISPECIES: hypothetical protein [unclassified Providencia]|uniref:hypothetical protein n=1 Tax=unclassified Providencia TaxID=2633465 RepID=UPI00234AEBA4|nr:MULTISPECIES: hypothetical protein [unclassified Providencia]